MGWLSDLLEGKVVRTTSPQEKGFIRILDSSVSAFIVWGKLKNNNSLELVCVILHLMNFK